MRLNADRIADPALQAVLGTVESGGHRALIVGGAVRNAILGLLPTDIDVATDASPARVAELAARAGLRVVPTGIDHGTVTVISAGKPFEVTTFRRDVSTDGRRAEVAFTGDLAADAARRDFTMNALYADREGNVVDPLGGLTDALARRVRFVGDPAARIREDYLRILRFFRFTACYGDPALGIDPEGLAACAENAGSIGRLSRERIGHEMRRLLGAEDPAPAVSAMEAAGVLSNVLPGASARALAPLVDAETGLCMPDWIRRLAAMAAEGEADALRLSRDEAKRLDAIKAGAASAAGPAELGYRLGEVAGLGALLVRTATSGGGIAPDAAAELRHGASAEFPISATDLMPALSGPALGARLRELEDRWIASGFALSREQLLA